MNNDHRQRSTFWKSFSVFALLIFCAIVFLYFYDIEKPKESAPKVESKKTETKQEFPKGQMEDGPALEDLPELPSLPVPVSKTDLIKIESLHDGDSIQSPLMVSGQARGNWFFEASFPIKILDKDGKVVGQGHAEAQAEWMTENFVPWKATISFIAPASGKGEVVFMKDNPSGLPEHDTEVSVSVEFAHPQ